MSTEIHPKMYMYRRIVEAKRFIDQYYYKNIDLNNISDEAHFSKYHFLRLFKESFGKTPHQYLISVRVLRAREQLKSGAKISDACYGVGFESIPSFCRLFKKILGVTPKQYIRKINEQKNQAAINPLTFVPNCFVAQFGWDK